MNDIEFQEKELKILRNAIDSASYALGKKNIQSKNITPIINILEKFLRNNPTLCYGGTAINNILPVKDRFYNKDIEVPDYDFFSPNALTYAKKLTDIYFKAGYTEVMATSGVHTGTYKVFVNFIPIADITYLDKDIFTNLLQKSIKVNGIAYCPPNFLRMSMYLELSRPMGDVSRWEKVLKRLILLNKHHPLSGDNCSQAKFARKYEGPKNHAFNIYNVVRRSAIDQGLVFFGGYASGLYGKYMSAKEKNQVDKIPDFDILSTEAENSAVIIKEHLKHAGYDNISINKKQCVGDLISTHYEIVVTHKNKTDVLCYIYNTTSCHSYNNITIDGEKLKIATIDTMLSFYLVFIYIDRPYYDVNRLLCMSEYLFRVQLKNRLEQKGLLKRFSIECYGTHQTLEDIRGEKSNAYKSLRDKKCGRGCKEFDMAFLRYIPSSDVVIDNWGNEISNETPVSKKTKQTKKQTKGLSRMKSKSQSKKYKR
jgi:hypothetical protein